MCSQMCTSVPSGRKNVPLFFLRKKYTSGTITNHRDCQQNWCYCQSKNFSGTSDNVTQLKTVRIISYEMPILLLIPC